MHRLHKGVGRDREQAAAAVNYNRAIIAYADQQIRIFGGRRSGHLGQP